MAYTLPAETRRTYSLVGPLSARQSLQLAVAGALIWHLWHGPLPVPLRAVLAGCLAVLGLAAAFGRWRGDDAATWAVRAARFVLAPRRRGGEAVLRWSGVEALRGEQVGLRGGAWVRLLEVAAVDFELKDAGEQEALLAAYRELLHALDFPLQVVACTEPAHPQTPSPRDDGLAPLATAYGRLLTDLAATRRILSRRYYVVLRAEGEAEEAGRRLADRAATLARGLERLGMSVREVGGEAALELLRRSFGGPARRLPAPPRAFRGLTPAGLVSPSGLGEGPDHVYLGGAFARSLVVTGYPRQIEPGWLRSLYAFPADLRISATIEPLDSARAVAELTHQLQDLRATQLKAERGRREPDPYAEAALEDAGRLRDALARGSAKLFRYHLELTLFAADLAELERTSRQLEVELESHLLLARRATFEQARAFRATLPLGEAPVGGGRSLDSFALSTTLPFLAAELAHPGGDLWGVNLRHNSLVLVDRFAGINGHSVTVAASGAGKSFWLKSVLTQARLRGQRLYVIDPQGEYLAWCQACGGRHLRLAPDSPDRLNPLDLAAGPRPVTARVDFAKSLCEVLLGRLTPREAALLDAALFAAYASHGQTDAAQRGTAPTLADLLAALEASSATADLALRLRPYVSGSLAMFAAATNVDLEADLLVFDLREIVRYERALAPAAYFVLAELLTGRLRAAAARSIVAVDEAHFLLAHPATARFVEGLFRAGRKLGAGVALVTQSLGDLLGEGVDGEAARSARACLANAATVLLMRQQTSREAELAASTFHLSRAEAAFLQTARRGEGLLIHGDQRAALRVEAPQELHHLFATEPGGEAAPGRL